MSRKQRRKTAQGPWLSAAELRAWRAFMAVQMRMNYEMNRQLQSDSDLSLADYHVLNALTEAPGGRLQVSDLAALIGWERSRASHQLRRLCERGLAERVPSRGRRQGNRRNSDEGGSRSDRGGSSRSRGLGPATVLRPAARRAPRTAYRGVGTRPGQHQFQ